MDDRDPPRGSDPSDINPIRVLYAQAKQGNRAALGCLLAQFDRRLLSLIERKLPGILRASVGAEDIVQETMIGAARGFDAFTPEDGLPPEEAIFRWLCVISRNRLRDKIKEAEADKRPVFENPGSESRDINNLLADLATHRQTPSRDARSHERIAAVRAAIALLDENDRVALELCCLMKLPTRQVAERLMISEEAVRKRCSRAIHALAESIDNISDYDSQS